jgi:hypothetical protein
VNQDEDADLTPTPPAGQDVNATISEDPAGGRRRRTRKQKRKSRKTRKHRR